MGLGDSAFGFTAVLYGLEAAVELWFGRIQSCQGTIVAVRDDWNRLYLKLMVTLVEAPVKEPARSIQGDVRGEVQLFGVTHAL